MIHSFLCLVIRRIFGLIVNRSIAYVPILLLLALLGITARAQDGGDKIVLLSGKVLDNVQVTTFTEIQIKYVDRNSRKKTERFIDKYRVFSVEYSNGKEEVIYEYDTLMENDFTVDEMRHFIQGEQDAMAYYHPRLNTLLAGVLSAAGGYALASSFFVVTVPFASTVIASLPKVKIRPEKVSDPKLLAQPTYILGYERVAKSHKIQNALKGSVLGVAAGISAFWLF